MAKIECNVCGKRLMVRMNQHSISKMTKNYYEKYEIYICVECKKKIIEGELKKIVKKMFIKERRNE